LFSTNLVNAALKLWDMQGLSQIVILTGKWQGCYGMRNGSVVPDEVQQGWLLWATVSVDTVQGFWEPCSGLQLGRSGSFGFMLKVN